MTAENEEKKEEKKIKLSGKQLIAILMGIITLTSMVGLYTLSGNQTTTSTNTVSVGQNPFKGGADAKVTIVIFSDYQCTYCQSFELNTLPQIETAYGDSVKIYFRNFPLAQLHPNAFEAAMAVECANDQGKFWEMHDMLFQNQNDWASIGLLKFEDYATSIGLNKDQFTSCMNSNKYQNWIAQDMTDGTLLGITGTPTIFINDKKVEGAQPFSVFKSIIDTSIGV